MGDEMVSNMISIFHWKSHYSTFCNKLSTFWEKEQYTDVTLACQGKYFQVHKLVLSTCSDYFEDILKNTPCKHPVIVLNEIKPDDLEVLLRFMYEGVIRVPQNYLQRLMKVASLLLIKGLGVRDDKSSEPKNKKDRSSNDEQLSPPSKRKKSEDNIQATIPPHFQPKPIKSNLYTDTQHPDSAVEKKSTVKVITDGSIVKEDIEEISDNSLADDDDDDFQCRSENEDDQHMEPLNNGSAAEDLAGPSGLQRVRPSVEETCQSSLIDSPLNLYEPNVIVKLDLMPAETPDIPGEDIMEIFEEEGKVYKYKRIVKGCNKGSDGIIEECEGLQRLLLIKKLPEEKKELFPYWVCNKLTNQKIKCKGKFLPKSRHPSTPTRQARQKAERTPHTCQSTPHLERNMLARRQVKDVVAENPNRTCTSIADIALKDNYTPEDHLLDRPYAHTNKALLRVARYAKKKKSKITNPPQANMWFDLHNHIPEDY